MHANSHLVARIASDRTSNYVFLLYSSDANRTLREYILEIEKRKEELRSANKHGDDEQRRHVAEGLFVHLTNLSRFYQFHCGSGDFGEEWARKNSIRMANSAARLVKDLIDAALYPTTRAITLTRLEKVMALCGYLISNVCVNHPSESATRIQRKYDQVMLGYEKKKSTGYRHPLIISKWIVEAVRSELPEEHWPKHIHKDIAAKLGLSIETTHRVISSILEEKNNY